MEGDKICFYTTMVLSLIFGSVIISCFAMFFNYNAKVNKEGVEISKIAHRTKELEKKNGNEMKKIEDLEKTRQEDRKILDNLQKEIQALKGRRN